MSSPSKAVDVLAVIAEARLHMAGRLSTPGAREITDTRLAEASAAVTGLIAALTAFRDAHDMLETEPDRLLVGMQMGCAYEMAVAALSTIGESQ